MIPISFSFSENNGSLKSGVYYDFQKSEFYHGYTYTIPQFIKYVIFDIGYLRSFENDEKSYYITVVSLNVVDMFREKTKEPEKKTLLIFEPGIWVGYDVLSETDEELGYGAKLSLINYEF